MNYNQLAHIYDALVKDDEATKKWINFVNKHFTTKGELLELACGSGEITLALAKEGYQVLGSDIASSMLEELRKKDSKNTVDSFELNMIDFDLNRKFDGILCFCDSINYLSDKEEMAHMFQCVNKHLEIGGLFLFDMHTVDRLDEFKEMFIEEGTIKDTQYQWTILSEEDTLHHHFSFWLDDGSFHQEMHQQKVFDVEQVNTMLQKHGFETQYYTDFIKEGIHEGEKIFVVGRKIR